MAVLRSSRQEVRSSLGQQVLPPLCTLPPRAPRLRPAAEPLGLPPLPPLELEPLEQEVEFEPDCPGRGLFPVEKLMVRTTSEDKAAPVPPRAPVLLPADSPFEIEAAPEFFLPPAATDIFPPGQSDVLDEEGKPLGEAGGEDGRTVAFSFDGSISESDSEDAGEPGKRGSYKTMGRTSTISTRASRTWSIQDFEVNTGKCISGPGLMIAASAGSTREPTPMNIGSSLTEEFAHIPIGSI